jgi:hypothetical protein
MPNAIENSMIVSMPGIAKLKNLNRHYPPHYVLLAAITFVWSFHHDVAFFLFMISSGMTSVSFFLSNFFLQTGHCGIL